MTCPSCAPKKRDVPDLVIPFYERDLCKLKYTAKSISLFDRANNLGDIYLVWVSTESSSKYKDALSEIKGLMAATHTVHLLDFSWQVNHAKKGGWYAQQVFKLKAASLVASDYYLVLDCKNTLIRHFAADTLFNSCNQANVFGEFKFADLPGLHQEWYNTSAQRLNVSVPTRGYWPTSITPMIFRKQTVFDLLGFINESSSPYNLCDGPLCDMLDDGATEFTLYLMYAYSRNEIGCTHHLRRMMWHNVGPGNATSYGMISISLWRGLDQNLRWSRTVAAGEQKPLVFGVQAGTLKAMNNSLRAEVGKYIRQIYDRANLKFKNVTSTEDLMECVG